LLDAKNKYKQYPALLTFESPNYKVRIGSFRTRLEAEKNLIEIKKSYPAAFVVGLK
jgi:sporulation domain protein